mgnify:CR=1 FL=1
MGNQFSWVKIYAELADALLAYKDDRLRLIGIVRSCFDKTGLPFPTLDYDGQIRDLDPWTVYAFFNKGITTEKRLKLLRAFAEAFGLKSELPSDFDGIPVVNNLKACFTCFTNDPRFGKDDVSNIWKLFELALKLAAGDNSVETDFVAAYDEVLKQYCVGWNITMGLFWIRPDYFVNLDGVNRSFLRNDARVVKAVQTAYPGIVKPNPQLPSGQEYLGTCKSLCMLMLQEEFPFKSFPALSHCAWKQSQENKQVKSDLYWLTANPERWSVKSMPVDSEEDYTVYNENHNLRQNAEAFKTLAVGDLMVGYQAGKDNGIYAILRCTKASDGTVIKFRKVCDLESPIPWQTIKDDPVLSQSGPVKSPQGSLHRLTKTEESSLWELMRASNMGLDEKCEGTVYRKFDMDNRTVWFWAPGEGGCQWEDCRDNGLVCLGWDELGDFTKYETRDQMERAIWDNRGGSQRPKNASLACWEFCRDVKVGDIVVAKTGLRKLLGIGRITGEYKYDNSRREYTSVRSCEWIVIETKTSPDKLPMKTLTNMTPWPDVVKKMIDLYHFDMTTLRALKPEDPEVDESDVRYTKKEFLNEVFMDETEYDRLVRLLLIKKNIILTGAPGVGKTFAAKRLAASILEVKDSDRIEFVQFHQSYCYEDFIGGYKPTESGFEYKHGVFYNFCKKAEQDPDGKYFFIIDEINRGNLSKIFGELLMLIEADKRGCESVRLSTRGESFSVPENLYIIGMMNTADRSLAMMDYALRRRFSFYMMKPGFDASGFGKIVKSEKMLKLVDAVRNLNEEIKNDSSLGDGFVIGHSYFIEDPACISEKAKRPEDIVEFDIAPTLREYWFDNRTKADEEIKKLNDVLL